MIAIYKRNYPTQKWWLADVCQTAELAGQRSKEIELRFKKSGFDKCEIGFKVFLSIYDIPEIICKLSSDKLPLN